MRTILVNGDQRTVWHEYSTYTEDAFIPWVPEGPGNRHTKPFHETILCFEDEQFTISWPNSSAPRRIKSITCYGHPRVGGPAIDGVAVCAFDDETPSDDEPTEPINILCECGTMYQGTQEHVNELRRLAQNDQLIAIEQRRRAQEMAHVEVWDVHEEPGPAPIPQILPASNKAVAPSICPTCGWTHDNEYTRWSKGEHCFTLAGVLPDIVKYIHQQAENGIKDVPTKDHQLREIVGIGYENRVGKAFSDLGRKAEYKALFKTQGSGGKRHFISFR